MDFNTFDLLLLVLTGLLMLAGLLKGLVRLLIGTGALVAAFILAARFHPLAARPVAGVLGVPEPAASLVGYLVIFLGTMLAGAFLARILRGVLKAAMLGWADRLAGAAVGLIAAFLAAALMVLPVVAYLPAGERLLRESALAPYVTAFADVASELVPEQLAERYRERMDALRQYWRQRRGDSGGRGDGSAMRQFKATEPSLACVAVVTIDPATPVRPLDSRVGRHTPTTPRLTCPRPSPARRWRCAPAGTRPRKRAARGYSHRRFSSALRGRGS